MPEWFIFEAAPVEVMTIGFRLVLALVCGYLVAILAWLKRPPGSRDSLTLTLVLMCILIAMATQIIGDNIARAFSLVGALSIVRFRTAVPATRDVAFVLAAVVVGMAIGAGQYWVTGLGILAVGLASLFVRSNDFAKAPAALSPDWKLSLVAGLKSMDSGAPRDWEQEVSKWSNRIELVSAESARRGGAMELNYLVALQADGDATRLIVALNALSSIESASLKRLRESV